jgi:hypothetical protein
LFVTSGQVHVSAAATPFRQYQEENLAKEQGCPKLTQCISHLDSISAIKILRVNIEPS